RLRIFVHDYMQTISEEGNAPALHLPFEQIVSQLRLVRDQLQEVSFLRRFQVGWWSLNHELPGDKQAEPIALFGLFQIVRRDENCHAAIGETVDHLPESAARQRIDTRGGFVEKEHAGFMHNRGAESNALFPAAGQTAGYEMASSFQSREGQHPSLLFG